MIADALLLLAFGAVAWALAWLFDTSYRANLGSPPSRRRRRTARDAAHCPICAAAHRQHW
ncbi:hypothetical protein [Modestobacter roseus]|uniref:hypothetical protein n=1 Tax=Modestobacter roseus TaxID=1181884 RepID=UPI0034DED6AD